MAWDDIKNVDILLNPPETIKPKDTRDDMWELGRKMAERGVKPSEPHRSLKEYIEEALKSINLK
tara:strand:- start:847 stop:1038 length:192 start_codon:yes stop_codon:yes gene_type:complete